MLDASVAGRWLLDTEREPAVGDVMELALEYGALVPPLFAYEMANVLTRWSRVVDPAAGRVAAAAIAAWPTAVDDQAPLVTALLDLALETGLSGYDAAYLELAERHGLPLATVDTKLAAAARARELVVLP